ncbi:hypothetical protein SERLADRAFT_440265 [Serpula lacrymans var. lacrymans S7.9]|uniref:Xylanolytic transcriptional activator regulatory domain-containing protein n=1 Tax=Serpula lacrymans var. lacrymans (strain S7.9) TaxID=578457 RepID=F8P3Z3_SERL9|nr:uncharacterized protein SERLADRAFT_440265 [Serpula lacrymans var. lacrymans S7.9]EGO22241.1 hypothetical protein SERLADRAFT_440265 [Serpula lacrymans var. lacrymans S7.9]
MSSPAYANFADILPSVRPKRRSAALSCAECRRLKLRFVYVSPLRYPSRSAPSPPGVVAFSPAAIVLRRVVPLYARTETANTEVLHDKIGQLAHRVRHLEDALSEAHAARSRDPHPLLAPELLKIKSPLERERDDPQPSSEFSKETNEAADAIGSLSISDHGRATFFGKAANSWYLLQNEEGGDHQESHIYQEIPLPSDLPWLSHAFPFSSSIAKTAEQTRGIILSLLPSSAVARHYIGIYYRHAAWMYTPIGEEEFYESIFFRIYHPDLSSNHDPTNSHRLGVLYLVLGLGILLDLDKPSHSLEAKQYYQLGRAALCLDSVLEEQSIIALQALLLMCHFMFLSDIEGPRWALMGLVVKMAHSIGLRDGKWNLDPEETSKRRALMWEIYTYDSWQSLTFGRPPSFSLAHIDCQMAFNTTQSETGEIEMSFAAWKHRFSSQCLSIVQDQAFGARTPSYKTIQHLDKQVREFYFPPSLQVPGFGNTKLGKEVEQPPIQLTMQRYIAFAIKEITLFYMHRGFFARAIEENPDDPLGSKYSPSVLAAYSSACSFVGLIESLFAQQPALTERMWFLFTHVFSCAIVLGAIATKSHMALAPSALSHLDSAHKLFEQVSTNPRAAKIIPIIQNLRRKAQVAAVEEKPRTNDNFRASYFGPGAIKHDKEFSSLGGMTRLVSRKTPSSPLSDLSGKEEALVSLSPVSVSSQPASGSPSLPIKESTPPSAIESNGQWQTYGHIHTSDSVAYPIGTYHSEQDVYGGNHHDIHSISQYPSYPTYNNPPLKDWYSTPQPMQSSPDSYYDPNATWQSFVAQYR